MSGSVAEKIGAWIKDTRTKRGQTQAEVAKACGLHTNTIVRYEAGSRIPGIPELMALAEWSGMGVGDVWREVLGG